MQDQTQEALFSVPSDGQKVQERAKLPPARPRLRLADRKQATFGPIVLEELLPADHKARMVWAVVLRWDLGAFLATIQARGETPGRAATDPRILLGLWLYAYSEGVGNGRELERLCRQHDAYRWICGGVSINYHTLNDFRVAHEKALDGLLTQMVAALMNANVIDPSTIANDGTRARASAGKNSFKTKETLAKDMELARQHVEQMKQQGADPNTSLQRQAAQERAAREKVERLQKAIDEVQKVQAAKDAQKEKPSKHQPAKASSTDPEARVMHFSDGGKRPGMNVQIAADVKGRAILAVAVTNAGNDAGQGEPLREQVENRTGVKVQNQLNDGSYATLDAINNASLAQTKIYAPVPKPRKEGVDPHAPKKGDAPGVIEWRERMGTPQAKTLYKKRASTIETVNADCKTHRGLGPFTVRGLGKVLCVALMSAMAYNLVHFGMKLVG